MDKVESQADNELNLAAKRTACEEQNIAPNAKRAKHFHHRLTEADGKAPAITRRVPFPEKVCQDFEMPK
jgi:histone acetyltransferase